MPSKDSEPARSENPQELTELVAQWQQNLQGRYRSSWTWLTRASASCIFVSAEKTSQLVKHFEKVREKNETAGEVWALMNLAYNTELLGPLVSSVTLAAFATESFLRLATCVCLYDKHNGKHTLIDRHLDALQSATFEERLSFVEELIGKNMLPQRARNAVKRLQNYRNNCAHDEPRFYGEVGDIKQYDRRTRTTKSLLLLDPPSIRLLGEKNRALTLRNALWAATTHDRLVRHVLKFAWPQLHKYHLCSESTVSHYIMESVPKLLTSEKLNAIADAWNEVDSYLENVTRSEQRDAIARLHRLTFKALPKD